ncbi:MAG: phosphosulfolactate synthase [Bacteroidota bacterium]
MNYKLPGLPERTGKPRISGINMVMDKGLSTHEAENLADTCAGLIDFIKLGFGTSLISPNLKDKLNIYRQAGIKTYFGGTLFEIFYVRNMVDDYRKYLSEFGMEVLEVSDGEVQIPHHVKCSLISRFSADFQVLSEVGSKEAGVIIPDEKWVQMMQDELKAGSWKVIAEARESGNIGIYNKDGSANTGLIEKIKSNIAIENIIWEAPQKPQQVYFIKQFGANVNLGNIPSTEVIALETIRLGLRGDTFFDFIGE